MTFRLEALFAFHGDALLLHYGSFDPHPAWILIDGGAAGTYNHFLRPRLELLKEDWGIDGSIPLRMIMVSHTDSDHISGVLDLFKDLKADVGNPFCEARTLWHNAFDDVIGNEDQELVSKLVTNPQNLAEKDRPDEETEAVISSVRQGRNLRLDAEALAMETNVPFRSASGNKPGLILADNQPIDLGHGLTFQVLGPNKRLVSDYQEKWNKYLKEKGIAEVEASAFNDPSAFNLASIVVLARHGNRQMLLTGDARGDFIVNGLVDAGLLDEEARYPVRQEGQRKRDWKAAIAEADKKSIANPFHVDLLKAPHHGSANNVEPGFFRRVTADHYVFSGNGNHHNPDPKTLRMLASARGDAPYTIHFTFTADQHTTEPNPKFAGALHEVHKWVENEKPDNCKVDHRAGDEALSVTVDLSE